ncbi:MAG: hypothetical protein AB3N23_21810 [Paracoccaceae bacterium]
MKKGDTAKLDAGWWKKNKSMRLRSKTFDKLLADYIDQKKLATKLGDSADAFQSAAELALKASNEAKALHGKCGRGQDETKAVLDGYTKLFASEAKKMSSLIKGAAKGDQKAEKQLATAEKAVKQVAAALGKHNKRIDVIEGNFDVWVDNLGAKDAVKECRKLWEDLEKLDIVLGNTDEALIKLEQSGQTRDVDPGGRRMQAAKKLTSQVRGLTARAQAAIMGVENRIKDQVRAQAKAQGKGVSKVSGRAKGKEKVDD